MAKNKNHWSKSNLQDPLRLTVLIEKTDLREIEILVEKGVFDHKSVFIREAIAEYLEEWK